MYGIANKPVTLVTQQVTSEGDVERITTAKRTLVLQAAVTEMRRRKLSSKNWLRAQRN